MVYAYPTELPVKEIQDTISTIRSQSFGSNKQQFAKDVWVIAGFGLFKAVGDTPQSFGATGTTTASISDEEACDHLQALLDAGPEAIDSANQEDARVSQALPPIPWQQIVSWALMLLSKLVI